MWGGETSWGKSEHGGKVFIPTGRCLDLGVRRRIQMTTRPQLIIIAKAHLGNDYLLRNELFSWRIGAERDLKTLCGSGVLLPFMAVTKVNEVRWLRRQLDHRSRLNCPFFQLQTESQVQTKNLQKTLAPLFIREFARRTKFVVWRKMDVRPFRLSWRYCTGCLQCSNFQASPNKDYYVVGPELFLHDEVSKSSSKSSTNRCSVMYMWRNFCPRYLGERLQETFNRWIQIDIPRAGIRAKIRWRSGHCRVGSCWRG